MNFSYCAGCHSNNLLLIVVVIKTACPLWWWLLKTFFIGTVVATVLSPIELQSFSHSQNDWGQMQYALTETVVLSV